MMDQATAPRLPAAGEHLRATVARLWPATRDACEVRNGFVACVDNEGEIYPASNPGPGWSPPRRQRQTREVRAASAEAWARWLRAVEHLARALEENGYAIARRGDARFVLGFAAAAVERGYS